MRRISIVVDVTEKVLLIMKNIIDSLLDAGILVVSYSRQMVLLV